MWRRRGIIRKSACTESSLIAERVCQSPSEGLPVAARGCASRRQRGLPVVVKGFASRRERGCQSPSEGLPVAVRGSPSEGLPVVIREFASCRAFTVTCANFQFDVNSAD